MESCIILQVILINLYNVSVGVRISPHNRNGSHSNFQTSFKTVNHKLGFCFVYKHETLNTHILGINKE